MAMAKSLNVVWSESSVTRARREALNGHRSCVLWFTGLSGAGKSTIANAVQEELFSRGCRTYCLDGDNVRHGLCADLGFTDADRHENIRRVGEVAKLMMDAGVIALAAFISPFARERDAVRGSVASRDFIEVYCNASLATCEKRDPKGFYRKARAGQIKNYTGIDSPYEAPTAPDLVLDTEAHSVEACVAAVIDLLTDRGVI